MGRRSRGRRHVSRLRRCFEIFCCAFCMKDVFCRDEFNADDDDVYEISSSVTPSSSSSDAFSFPPGTRSYESDDIIVTRVYASASAQNVVKEHKNFYPRSESAMGVDTYIAKKLEKLPVMRSFKPVDWQTPANADVIKQARTIDLVDALDIHPDVEYDMFADNDQLTESENEDEMLYMDEAGDAVGTKQRRKPPPSTNMTVEKIKRSQSMWSLSTSRRYSVNQPTSPRRSASIIPGSMHDLSEDSTTRKGLISKLRKRPRSKHLQATRFSTGPCLCGDVDAVDSNGRSLLFYSARYGQLDTAVQLIEAGCSPDQRDVLGNTPLHEAIEKGHLEIAEAFLKDGKSDVNVKGVNGETPLMTAVTRGQLDAVKLLVKYGACVNECDAVENPPIYRALQRGWNEIADFLLDQQCDVNRTTANGMTCFFAAAHCNKINIGDIAKRLLKTDYDFKRDAEWLATEGCPINVKEDHKHHHKIMIRAGLQSPRKKSFLSNGKQKLVKTFRSISKESS